MKLQVKVRSITFALIFVFGVLVSVYCLSFIKLNGIAEHFSIQIVKTNNAAIHHLLEEKFFGKNLLFTSFSKITATIEEALEGEYSNIVLNKILPSTLQIDVYINKPIVYVQSSNGTKLFFDYLGSRTYKVLHTEETSLQKLVQLEGNGAENNFIELFNIINKMENIECNKMVFIDNRRWNIHLRNGLIVKLSEKNYENEVLFLQKLINKYSLINEVGIIDLRFYPEKIFVSNKKRDAKN